MSQLVFTGAADDRTGHIARILAYRMCLEMSNTAVATAELDDVRPFARGFENNLSAAVLDSIRTQASFTQRAAVLHEIGVLLNTGTRMCVDVLGHVRMLFPGYDWRLLEGAGKLMPYLESHGGCDFFVPGVLQVALIATAIDPGREMHRIWYCENEPPAEVAPYFKSRLPNIAMPADPESLAA